MNILSQANKSRRTVWQSCMGRRRRRYAAAFTRYLAEAVPQLQPLQEHLPSAHLPLLQHSGATLHVHAAPPLPPHLLQKRRMNTQV